jgi:hypothetical protein
VDLELIKKISDKLERKCDINKVKDLYETKRVFISKKTDAYQLSKEKDIDFKEDLD